VPFARYARTVATRAHRWRRWLWAAAGLLVAALAVLYAVNTRGDLPLAVVKAHWAEGDSRFMDVGGLAIHYRDEGQGAPPIMLIHGTSASLHTWEGWAARLRADHRVVRFDLPAFGVTGPSPSRDYRVSTYADLVKQIADRLGLGRFVVGGNSLGGDVAWQFALDHPERVSALILVDAAGYPLYATGVPLAFKLARLPVLSALLANLDPRPFVVEAVDHVYGDPARIAPGVIDRYYELALRPGNRKAFVDRMRAPDPDRSGRVRELRVPTLVLWGARDRVIPIEAGRRFAADISGSRLIVYDDLGHVPMEEDPARTVADVEAFLAALPPAR
jgi:pimeloyl-ACP methyl ester carboxylesterase